MGGPAGPGLATNAPAVAVHLKDRGDEVRVWSSEAGHASLSVSLRGLGSGRRGPLPILRPLANGCDGRQRVRLFPCLYGVHVLVVPCLLATLKMTVAILIERQIELPFLGSHLGLVANHLLLHVFRPLLHLLDLGGTGAAGATSFRRTTDSYHDDEGMGAGHESIHFSTHEQEDADRTPLNVSFRAPRRSCNSVRSLHARRFARWPRLQRESGCVATERIL